MQVTDREVKEAPILVVDDSIMSLREMKTLLEEHGYKDVKTINNPNDVVEQFRSKKYKLVILDYFMPEKTGEDVLDELNSEFPNSHYNVLFWTSASEENLCTRALKKGAMDFLRKENVRDEEIGTRVYNLIKSQLMLRKLNQQNKRLNQKVKKRTEQLERMSLETIGRVAQAAEFRDNETGGHIKRIGVMASEMAKLLEIDDSICDAIRYAAPMHDVGKIRISDEILFKPGSLTSEEWAEMKEHTTAGAMILSGSDHHQLNLAKNIALYHHENWNGEGYPDGLSEGEIPIEARITAVCDVYDAVLSDRPYKDPWTEDEALQLIQDEKGEQFDPDIADCFLNNADLMSEIRRKINAELDKEGSVLSTTGVV